MPGGVWRGAPGPELYLRIKCKGLGESGLLCHNDSGVAHIKEEMFCFVLFFVSPIQKVAFEGSSAIDLIT